MDVILLKDYAQLGFIGDVVGVKRGYARNYLIPNGIAVEAGTGSAKQAAHRRREIDARKVKLKTEAEGRGEDLAARTLEFKLKVGEKGKAFGSVGSRDIEAELKKLGFEVHRRQIQLTEPLKKAGEFKVTVKLHSDVAVEVTVKVTGEVQKVAKPKDKKKGKKGDDELEAASEEALEGEEGTEVESEDENSGEEEGEPAEVDEDSSENS